MPSACARLILEAFKKYPQLVEVPSENTYLLGMDGRMVYLEGGGAVVLVPGVYDALKAIYADRTDALAVFSGLSGFMWGWAYNAAMRCLDLPPVPNPALMTIDVGGK